MAILVEMATGKEERNAARSKSRRGKKHKKKVSRKKKRRFDAIDNAAYIAKHEVDAVVK